MRPKVAKLGRPTKYKAAYASIAKDACRKYKYTDAQLAVYLKVDPATIYRWKNEHPDFCEALTLGKLTPDGIVQSALYRRAVGYRHKAVKIFCNKDGEVTQVPYIEHYPPDTAAAHLWLANRQPEEWRTKEGPLPDTEPLKRLIVTEDPGPTSE
jgi:hypothetical protein